MICRGLSLHDHWTSNRFNNNGSKARKTAESKCQVVKYWLQNNRKSCLPNHQSLKIIYRSPWSKQISLLFRKKNWKQTKISSQKPYSKYICLFLWWSSYRSWFLNSISTFQARDFLYLFCSFFSLSLITQAYGFWK